MLRNKIISIVIILLILITPNVQAFASDDSILSYLDELLGSLTGGESDTDSGTDIDTDADADTGSDVADENNSSSSSYIESIENVSGQDIYDYYKSVETASGKRAAVTAVASLIEPILDEYAPLGLSKPVAYAQLIMESRFFSSDLSRIGNNPFGLKGDGYIGETDEYMDGQLYILSLSFQVYDDFEDGVRGYCHLMMKSRYLPVRQATNYVDAAKQIKECGYASDPDYVGDGDIVNQPIIGILDNIEYYDLDQFEIDTIDPNNRDYYIWHDIKKISWTQSLKDEYLRSRSEEIQTRLQSLGYYDSKIDGWFGNKSKTATKAYQTDKDLYVDGVVGIYTYESLFPEKFTADIGISYEIEEPEPVDDGKARWDVSVSSYLIPSNSYNGPFTASMMTDNDISSCWIPSANRSGIGETITLTLSNGQEANFDSVDIFAGYGRTDAHYYTNYRIKNVSIYIDDAYIGDFELQDIKSEQSINLGGEYNASKVVIKINDCYISQSYSGYQAWEDLCVSEVWIDGEVLE